MVIGKSFSQTKMSKKRINTGANITSESGQLSTLVTGKGTIYLKVNLKAEEHQEVSKKAIIQA
jgi:hypothetical protein